MRTESPRFIRQIADRLHRDAHRAARIVGVVLHELRDRLPAADAANVARQLPAALRRFWKDEVRHPGTIEQPYKLELLGAVMECGTFPTSVEAEQAVVAVLSVLQRRLDRVSRNTHGVSALFGQLPPDLAVLWHAAEACETNLPRRRPPRAVIAERRTRAAARSSAA